MWNLNIEKLASLAPGDLGSIAVETGTCRGNGARALAKHFTKVITIELGEELHRTARERLRELPHVDCLQGNSADVLARILPQLGPVPIFFFLDAHWSGDRSVDWAKSEWKGYGLDTAHSGRGEGPPSGPEQCPLLEELRAIVSHCEGPAHILIDDMKNIPKEGLGSRDKAFAGEDWSHLSREKLFAAAQPRLIQVHFLQEPEQLLLFLKPPA